MVKDLETARSLCELSVADKQLLTSPAHPIVLARRQQGPKCDGIAPAVAPGNRYLGLMLPYTPLHHLIAGAVGEPFVLTSGNVSDEPIAYEDEDALKTPERDRRRLLGPRPGRPHTDRRFRHQDRAGQRRRRAPLTGVRATTSCRPI